MLGASGQRIPRDNKTNNLHNVRRRIYLKFQNERDPSNEEYTGLGYHREKVETYGRLAFVSVFRWI